MHVTINALVSTALVLLLAASGATSGAEVSEPASGTTKPNVLWIGVDQMRYDTPGCNGNPICQTPNIDRLAREGVNFTNAYTTCCLCSPARASMFTGRFAFTHGMGTNCDLYHALAAELPRPDMLLHRRLMKLGYRCAFAGKWHVGARTGAVDHGFEGMNLPGYGNIKKSSGFQKYLEDSGLNYGAVKNPIFGNPNQKTLLAGHWDGPVESTPSYYLASYTIDLLDKLAADGKPFLLTCQFWGPHAPFLPSREFLGRHDRQAIEPWINFEDDLSNKPVSVRRFRSDFYRTLPDDWSGWREIVGLYYDFTTLVDQQIGRILNRLDQLGLSQNTIVIFESDHGDTLGSHGGLFDKGFMYQEAYRIPMIVRWPARCRSPRTSSELVYNMDVLPTVLDVLGHADETLDGRSFLPALDAKPFPEPREAVYLEFHGIRYLFSQRALVTRDGHKYIFNPGNHDEFYDLNADPGELVNLIDSQDHKAKISDVRERLKAAARKARDPISDYIAKIFGDWENLSGQFEAAAFVPGKDKE